MASRSQRQRIQQTEDPSHQRQAGSRTQATRQGQHPITAPLQQLQELANHSPRLAQLRQLQELANRSPQVAQLRRLQELAISSPQTTQLRSLQELANNGPQVAQLRQLQMLAEKAEPSAAAVISTTKPQAAASQPNLTGLPDRLKSNLEALSGLSMDAVRVHYNSSKPAQLHALAYAQGTDIHIGPGQERHLPHEAWHVVQQAQGRVRPTLQMAAGVAVNDDAGLEREADVMGGRAVEGPTGNTRYGSTILANLPAHTQGCACTSCSSPGGETAVQRQLNMKLIQRCTHCGDPTCLKGEKCRKPPTGLFVNTAGNWGTKFYNEKRVTMENPWNGNTQSLAKPTEMPA